MTFFSRTGAPPLPTLFLQQYNYKHLHTKLVRGVYYYDPVKKWKNYPIYPFFLTANWTSIITLLPTHFSKQSTNSRLATSLQTAKLIRPPLKCVAILHNTLPNNKFVVGSPNSYFVITVSQSYLFMPVCIGDTTLE